MSTSKKPTHHFETRIQAWGNSMGLRITRAVSEAARLEKGAVVTMELTDEGLLIRPKQAAGKVWTEEELLAGLTPYKAHADELPELLNHEFPG
jgi:antitoxin MazE